MAFINIIGPLERRRSTVTINLGNERHFSAGQTVADNMCVCLETVVLGMCWNLYENLNSPDVQSVTHKHSLTRRKLWFHQCHDHQVSMTKFCSLIKIAILQSLAIENKAQGSEIKHWQNTHNLERQFPFEPLSKKNKNNKKGEMKTAKREKLKGIFNPKM